MSPGRGHAASGSIRKAALSSFDSRESSGFIRPNIPELAAYLVETIRRAPLEHDPHGRGLVADDEIAVRLR